MDNIRVALPWLRFIKVIRVKTSQFFRDDTGTRCQLYNGDTELRLGSRGGTEYGTCQT